MNKKYRVTLTEEERLGLEDFLRKGKASARKLTHARILLKADAGDGAPGWSDEEISRALDVNFSTIARLRCRFIELGFDAALHGKPPARRYHRHLDGEQEAHLIALACGKPPAGFARWNLRLLARRFVELGHAAQVSHETVRQTLKKTS